MKRSLFLCLLFFVLVSRLVGQPAHRTAQVSETQPSVDVGELVASSVLSDTARSVSVEITDDAVMAADSAYTCGDWVTGWAPDGGYAGTKGVTFREKQEPGGQAKKYYRPSFHGVAEFLGSGSGQKRDYSWDVFAHYEVKPLVLEKVVFNNVNNYYKDPVIRQPGETGNLYRPGDLVSPQDWVKGRGNDPAVFYSSNSNPTVTIEMTALSPAANVKLSLRGTGPDNIKAERIDVAPNISGDTVAVSDIPLTGLTGSGVKYYPNMSLSWEASINGGEWFGLGTSSNEMYVSWKQPTTAQPVVTEVHIAVTNAVGVNSEGEVINKLVSHFGGRGVKEKGGTPLAYYMAGVGTGQRKYGLIYRANSDCAGWADLFVGVLGCHGISSKEVILETTGATLQGGQEDMKIQTYNLVPLSSGITPYLFEAILVQKLPGQNNPNPHIDQFPNHHIVEISTARFFDPSYGIAYPTNRAGVVNNEFVKKSISAFGPRGPQGSMPDARPPRNDGTEVKFRQ